MLTSNLTCDRKVNQIILSTTVMVCLTIFCLLSKSDIIYKTKANFARISSLVEKELEYETEKIEAEEDQIIEREQIVLRKQIKDVCHSKQFRHITTSIDSFIIDSHHHFAYCRQAKVILIDCLIN